MKCEGCGEFLGSVSFGLCAVTGQVKGSKTGADVSLLPFRSAPSTEVDTELCQVLGMAGEHTQQYWVSRLSVLTLSPCPLQQSICTEKVCQTQKMRSHKSFFPFWASDLHLSDCHIRSKGVHVVLLPIADKNWQYL